MQVIETADTAFDNPAIAALNRIWFQHHAAGGLPALPAFFEKFPQQLKPYSFVVRITPTPFDAFYVFAGTMLEKLTGDKLQGRSVNEVYNLWIRKTVIDSYQEAIKAGRPLYQRRQFATLFKKIGYERLLMPMADADGCSWAVTVVFPTDATITDARDWQVLIEETPWFTPPRSDAVS